MHDPQRHDVMSRRSIINSRTSFLPLTFCPLNKVPGVTPDPKCCEERKPGPYLTLPWLRMVPFLERAHQRWFQVWNSNSLFNALAIHIHIGDYPFIFTHNSRWKNSAASDGSLLPWIVSDILDFEFFLFQVTYRLWDAVRVVHIIHSVWAVDVSLSLPPIYLQMFPDLESACSNTSIPCHSQHGWLLKSKSNVRDIFPQTFLWVNQSEMLLTYKRRNLKLKFQ